MLDRRYDGGDKQPARRKKRNKASWPLVPLFGAIVAIVLWLLGSL
jgi:hypothetical protein